MACPGLVSAPQELEGTPGEVVRWLKDWTMGFTEKGFFAEADFEHLSKFLPESKILIPLPSWRLLETTLFTSHGTLSSVLLRCVHRTTEWLRMEGTTELHLVPPPCSAGSSQSTQHSVQTVLEHPQ